MGKKIQINGHSIGENHPTYIVAEMSGNHGHDFEQAVQILKAAKDCGADAIKLQTYTPETITLLCNNRHFQLRGGTLYDGRTLYDLYTEAHTPWEWQPKLKAIADAIGLDLFSAPFDDTAVDFLSKMNIPAYKVASPEIVDIPLIEKIAGVGKPIIFSTGMATLTEIQMAIAAAQRAGAKDIALLKCTSAYPAPPEEMNLVTIPAMTQTFGVPVGLSDHTLGTVVPVAGVALGAAIVEKHLTLTRSLPGPDTAFSLEPKEFKEMVDAIRITEKSLGKVHYGVTAHEKAIHAYRRSLFVVKDIEKGAAFTSENVRSIRPGHGLPPSCLETVLGKTATVALERGTPLEWAHIVEENR